MSKMFINERIDMFDNFFIVKYYGYSCVIKYLLACPINIDYYCVELTCFDLSHWLFNNVNSCRNIVSLESAHVKNVYK
jgi:hypothetical protein